MISPKTTACTLVVATTLFVTSALQCVRAQTPEPLVQPPPFAYPQAQASAPTSDPGRIVALELDARRAVETGLPSIAVELYQQLLANPAITSSTSAQNRIVIALTTALIEEDRLDEATATLVRYSGEPTPAVRLRQAIIDTRNHRLESARATAVALRPDDLSLEDRGWLFYLRGLLAEEARDFNQAATQYQQAGTSNITASQKAWFDLARSRARLFVGDISENTVTDLRRKLDDPAGGLPTKYAAISQLAAALNALGRRAEAISLLQAQLQYLAPQETATRDDWLLLLGMIAGTGETAGREAFTNLITNSADRDKQRIALRMLSNAAQAKVGNVGQFRLLLDRLIAAPTPHPILSELLLTRAQLSLSEKKSIDAENDANRLRSDFPTSTQLRISALGVLTAAAWEQARYRAAAARANETRAEIRAAATQANPASAGQPLGGTYAQLGVLSAEASFRAKDFRNASDAYGSALSDVPTGVEPGMLMFQRVYSEMQAGGTSLDNAQKILDSYEADSRFDTVNRWQAEWNLSRALQTAGETAKAYARVNRLLANATPASPVPADLRARMAWLQARLAYDSGNFAESITHAEKLLDTLTGVEAGLRDEIASTTMLLEVEAAFAQGQKDPNATTSPIVASDVLKKLRATYPKTEAAARSYIIEADDAAKRGQLVEAQGLLQKLADDYSETPYAPYALYQAAIYVERRAQDQYYLDAYRILEKLATKYKTSELVFYARLKQGNLLRLMNDYGRALTIYSDLVNRYKFPQYPEGLIAELALADCYAALATTDVSRAESAAAIYQRLLDQPTAPADLRVEAGYKFGLNLIARNTPARLETTWWQMVNTFLLDDARAATLGPKGRYWMSRTLLKLGEILEQQSKLNQAREVYDLIVKKNLPGVALAEARINRATQ